jgi:hypothetical protein
LSKDVIYYILSARACCKRLRMPKRPVFFPKTGI